MFFTFFPYFGRKAPLHTWLPSYWLPRCPRGLQELDGGHRTGCTTLPSSSTYVQPHLPHLCRHTPDPRSIAARHRPWHPPHLCGLTTTIPRPRRAAAAHNKLPRPRSQSPQPPHQCCSQPRPMHHSPGTTRTCTSPTNPAPPHLHITEMNGHVMGTEAIPYGPFIFSGQRQPCIRASPRVP